MGECMAIAIWNARYETGIRAIDLQHQSLFEAVNALVDAFTAGNAHVQVKASLDFLERYAEEHFTTEEQFMESGGYPGLASHRGEHEFLRQQVKKLQARMEAGEIITLDTAIFLSDWLKRHIREVDMRYVEFLRPTEEGAESS